MADVSFDFGSLRRFPDIEADNLEASDAADRYLLDHTGGLIQGNDVVVIGDNYGALTLGALAAGATSVRVHQDALSGELALRANAGDTAGFEQLPLDHSLVSGAGLVLVRLPRSLDALDEIAALVAAHAAPSVTVIAGGRLKHMSLGMNEVLARHFGSVEATLARQKSRLLIARSPQPAPSSWPKREFDEALGLWVCSTGAAFAGPRVDIGTRLLVEQLGDAVPDARTIIDLGCGTGVLAATLARGRTGARVIASDQSAAAVASARLTMLANGVDVHVVRDVALASQPDASAQLVVLNPPFHVGATVHTGVALRLFDDAARVLEPGGELWAVWNSHLGYRAELERSVGPTRQIVRNSKFTVTASVRR